jgi:GTP-binding protein
LTITAEFVTSAADAAGFPRELWREVAFVGRSNVGKSSLINALVRQRVARTSAAAGKTRLANFYRVARGTSAPLHFVDLPGYGYARGGSSAAAAFDALARDYFERGGMAGLLLVDCRHPGLASDRRAWSWMRSVVAPVALVATKIDKLSGAQQQRAVEELESVFEHVVLPVSAVTGEGLEELWKLIDTLANNPHRNSRGRPTPTRPRKK